MQIQKRKLLMSIRK